MIATHFYRFALYIGIAAILYIYSPALTISYLAIIACREVGLVVLSRSSAPGSSGGQPANKADLSDGKSPPPPDKEKEKEKEKEEEEEEPVIRKSDSLYKLDWQDDDENATPTMTTALAATAKAPQPDVGDEDIQKIQNRIREIIKCIDGENEKDEMQGTLTHQGLDARFEDLAQEIGCDFSPTKSKLSLSEKLNVLEAFVGINKSS